MSIYNALTNFLKDAKKTKKKAFIEKDKILYPNLETINSLHDQLIKEFKNKQNQIISGVKSESNLEHAILNITNYLNEEFSSKKEEVVFKGAHLFNSLVTDQIYYDGNKRTAFATLLLYLSLNGIEMYFKNIKELDNAHLFIKKIAVRKTKDPRNIKEIVDWIKKHSK